MSDFGILERVPGPVGESLNVDAARKLLEIEASPDAAARFGSLAEKANEGLLNAAERPEYAALVAMSDVVAILQAHARLRLQRA